ncbi:DUF2177 family protein [Rhizomicrobium electricum]|uniref:DUF2177 family protein n=1 Tax=Rhizomicrobium electricum TaxID=480070 RepID=A0ABN1F7K8_9PROT|nr:DUF2177 family protein [Rhizomicrobium electricum]NIJ46708.1 putative membrane protein [Rhizomicrobium electricum]
MSSFLTRYISALVPFFLIDMIWLGQMAPRFYKPIMNDIALSGFRILPAVAFYLLFPIGMVLFVVNPSLKSQSWQQALYLGALFGAFTYGTYDLTNQATLRNWTWQLSLIDILWGSVLIAASSAISYAISLRLAPA